MDLSNFVDNEVLRTLRTVGVRKGVLVVMKMICNQTVKELLKYLYN